MALDPFYAAYEALSERGVCDAPGGMEYKRVRLEWVDAGCPDAYWFIPQAANKGLLDAESIH